MSALDAPLKAAVENGVLGCVAAMAATSQGVIHEAAFGVADPETGAAMRTDSVGWIASLTKALVSVAALQMVERGELSLDGPIAEVIPELATPKVLTGFGADGTPQYRPAARPITLRHLLTHSAGFGYDMWNEEVLALTTRHGVPRIPTNAASISNIPLLFDPGTRFNYGINVDFVGHAISVVSGRGLDEVLRTAIFTALGMTDTCFVPGESQVARRVLTRQVQQDGSLATVPWRPPSRMAYMAGGGGLYGSAADYLRFLREMLAGAPNLLRPETFAEMERNQIGDLTVGPMTSCAPAASRDVSWYPGNTLRWGLGFLLNEQQTPQGRSPGSLAWAGLPNHYYWIDRKRDVCGVFMGFLLPFSDARAMAGFWGWEKAVYQAVGTPA
jgi:hypothetical protein